MISLFTLPIKDFLIYSRKFWIATYIIFYYQPFWITPFIFGYFLSKTFHKINYKPLDLLHLINLDFSVIKKKLLCDQKRMDFTSSMILGFSIQITNFLFLYQIISFHLFNDLSKYHFCFVFLSNYRFSFVLISINISSNLCLFSIKYYRFSLMYFL